MADFICMLMVANYFIQNLLQLHILHNFYANSRVLAKVLQPELVPDIPYSKKHWWSKTLVNKDCRKFGGKNFGKLKSICIGNVMEIVKIGKKTWRIAIIHQICQSFFTAKVFYFTVAILGF